MAIFFQEESFMTTSTEDLLQVTEVEKDTTVEIEFQKICLLDILKKAQSAASNKADNYQNLCKFSFDSDEVKIETFDGESVLELTYQNPKQGTVKFQTNHSGIYAFDPKLLLNGIKMFKTEVVKFTFNKTSVIVTGPKGKKKFELELGEVDQMNIDNVLFKAGKPFYVVGKPAKFSDFIKPFNQVFVAASKSDARPILMSMNFSSDENMINVLATDSHVVTKRGLFPLTVENIRKAKYNEEGALELVDTDDLIEEFGKESFIISLDFFDNLNKVFDKDDLVVLSLSESGAMLQAYGDDKKSFVGRSVAGNYPNVEKVLDASGVEYTFNFTDFKNTIDDLVNITTSTGNSAEGAKLAIQAGSCTVESFGRSLVKYESELSVETDNTEEFIIGINPRNFAQILSFYKGETITLTMSASNKPIALRVNEDYNNVVLTPTLINK